MTEAVLAAIRAERQRQDEIWGAEHEPGNSVMLAVLVEECGEVARALIDRWPAGPDEERLWEELV